MIIFRERHEGDAERFESALMKAKKGIKEACEIFEEMKDEFSERGGGSGSYGERYSPTPNGMEYRMRGQSMSERDWQELQERRRRDSMGRYM